jgi:hypothetical protein
MIVDDQCLMPKIPQINRMLIPDFCHFDWRLRAMRARCPGTHGQTISFKTNISQKA